MPHQVVVACRELYCHLSCCCGLAQWLIGYLCSVLLCPAGKGVLQGTAGSSKARAWWCALCMRLSPVRQRCIPRSTFRTYPKRELSGTPLEAGIMAHGGDGGRSMDPAQLCCFTSRPPADQEIDRLIAVRQHITVHGLGPGHRPSRTCLPNP